MAEHGKTTICETRGNKKGAVTFTTDDGLLKSVRFYVSIWQELGLKGTCAMPAGSPGDWHDWLELMKTGCLDIGNHSFSHPQGGLVNSSWEELEREVNGAQAELDAHLEGFKTICFLCPEGAYNDLVIKKIQEKHVANRVVDRGYNSFNPTKQEIFRLKRQQILADTPLSEMNGWIDRVITDGTWLIEAYHGCDGEGWQPPAGQTLQEHYQYVASKLDDVWCGTFQEVVTYIKEKNEARLELISRDEAKIVLNMTDTLDDAIYTTPLTLRTELSDSWTGMRLRATQNGVGGAVAQVKEGDKLYAYYEAIPDRGKIELVVE